MCRVLATVPDPNVVCVHRRCILVFVSRELDLCLKLSAICIAGEQRQVEASFCLESNFEGMSWLGQEVDLDFICSLPR